MSSISLFIPKVYSSVSKQYIKSVFEENLKLGKISHIDTIIKIDKNNNSYYSAYIYFEYWNNNTLTVDFLSKINDRTNTTRIFYENSRNVYWIVLRNNSTRNINQNISQTLPQDETIFHTPEKKNIQTCNAPVKEQNPRKDIIDLSYLWENLNVQKDINNCITRTYLGKKNI